MLGARRGRLADAGRDVAGPGGTCRRVGDGDGGGPGPGPGARPRPQPWRSGARDLFARGRSRVASGGLRRRRPRVLGASRRAATHGVPPGHRVRARRARGSRRGGGLVSRDAVSLAPRPSGRERRRGESRRRETAPLPHVARARRGGVRRRRPGARAPRRAPRARRRVGRERAPGPLAGIDLVARVSRGAAPGPRRRRAGGFARAHLRAESRGSRRRGRSRGSARGGRAARRRGGRRGCGGPGVFARAAGRARAGGAARRRAGGALRARAGAARDGARGARGRGADPRPSVA